MTVIRFCPGLSATPEADQEVVPEAVPPESPAELLQVTRVTPTLSEAVPERSTSADALWKVAALVGPVMATLGGLLSSGL